METSSSHKTLVVLLHGYAMKATKYKSLKDSISNVIPGADFINPQMPLSVLSCANPNVIVNDILKLVDTYWESLTITARQSLRIVIIGHSTGALIARKLYVAACGENQDAPIEKEILASQPREWAVNVERMLLFAGINKGWTINSHLPFLLAAGYGFLILVGKAMRILGLHPIAFKTRKGNSFITQLRIQALSMLKHAGSKKNGNALIVQLLGTQDSVVSPEDNIDLATDNNFIYIEIPVSDHLNVINMTGEKGLLREKTVVHALMANAEQLKVTEIIPSDQHLPDPDPTVTDVVFVIHGIRDTGYWTQKIARRVKSRGDKIPGKKFAIETSTYGYFPMLSFLLYPFRQYKVEWLMDQYVENLALYPNADFSFVGHSNGTYLLAKALIDYPASRFKNVVLAGSVVHHNYNWEELIAKKRVESVYNFVATNDWVVGIFPRTFQVCGIQDLGSGGFDGFSNLGDTAQFKYIEGGHGAAIEESIWDEITHLTLFGQPSETTKIARKERSRPMKMLTWAGPLIFLSLLLLLFYIGVSICNIPESTPMKFIFVSVYLFLVWKLLTKF